MIRVSLTSSNNKTLDDDVASETMTKKNELLSVSPSMKASLSVDFVDLKGTHRNPYHTEKTFLQAAATEEYNTSVWAKMNLSEKIKLTTTTDQQNISDLDLQSIRKVITSEVGKTQFENDLLESCKKRYLEVYDKGDEKSDQGSYLTKLASKWNTQRIAVTRLQDAITSYSELLYDHYETRESDVINVCRSHLAQREMFIRKELETFYESKMDHKECEAKLETLTKENEFLKTESQNLSERSVALTDQLKYWKREAELLKLEIDLVFQRQGKIRLEKKDLQRELDQLKGGDDCSGYCENVGVNNDNDLINDNNQGYKKRPTSARMKTVSRPVSAKSRPGSAAAGSLASSHTTNSNMHASCYQKIQTLNSTISHQAQTKKMISQEFVRQMAPIFRFKNTMDRESFSLDDVKDLMSVFERKPALAEMLLEFLNSRDPPKWFQSYLKIVEEEMQNLPNNSNENYDFDEDEDEDAVDVNDSHCMNTQNYEDMEELAEEFSTLGCGTGNRETRDEINDDSSSPVSPSSVSPSEPLSPKTESMKVNGARPMSSRTRVKGWNTLKRTDIMSKTIYDGERNYRFLQQTNTRAEQTITEIYEPDLVRKTRPVSPVHPRIKRTPNMQETTPIFVRNPAMATTISTNARSNKLYLVAQKAQVFSRPLTASQVDLSSSSTFPSASSEPSRGARILSASSYGKRSIAPSGIRCQSASLRTGTRAAIRPSSVTHKKPSRPEDNFLTVSGKRF